VKKAPKAAACGAFRFDPAENPASEPYAAFSVVAQILVLLILLVLFVLLILLILLVFHGFHLPDRMYG